jgi:DNA-binding CsgD family transcriptional regulator
VLVAAGLRPRQLSDVLAGLIQRAHDGGTLSTIELGGLSAGEARELLGPGLNADTAEALYEESSGNPFYLQQLARSPRSTGATGSESLAGVEVPRAVAAALRAELALLDEDDRRILEGAAVAGDPFEPELAAAAAGVSEEAALDALDELVRRDLVRETEVPRRFRFRHPLVRGALYEAVPAGWRLAAHERAAAALAKSDAPITTRAHHVERSARQGDTDAVAVLRAAGEASAARAPAAAARLFGAALRLMPATADPADRVQLLEGMAGTHAATGQFHDAYEAMRDSLELRAEDALPERVRLTAALSTLEHFIGRHREAHARLVAALEDLPDAESPEGVALMTELAFDGFFRMDYKAMRTFGQRAVDAGKRLGDRPQTATAAGLLAFGQVLDGVAHEAEATCTEAAALVDGMSDSEVAQSRRAINNLSCAEFYLDRYEDARMHSERALRVAMATGQGQFIPILFWTGMIRLGTGRLREAAELQENAVEVARLLRHAQGLGWNLCGRALTAIAAGETEVALATAEEAVTAVEGEGESFPLMWARFGLGAALLEAGEADHALELLLQAGGGEELPRLPSGWRPEAFELLTRCALAAKDRDLAGRAAAMSESCAASQSLRMPRSYAERAAAAVALHDGETTEAAERALRAAGTAAEVGAPVEAAISRTLAGRALAQAGERERAVAELGTAAAAFEACGAVARRDAADRELGKLGRRVHRRTRRGKADGTGIEALTERELEVARLVVDRHTNAQIAAELFLSPKTVETHIRHLFQKLEVSSRVEVARVVERAERGTLTK